MSLDPRDPLYSLWLEEIPSRPSGKPDTLLGPTAEWNSRDFDDDAPWPLDDIRALVNAVCPLYAVEGGAA